MCHVKWLSVKYTVGEMIVDEINASPNERHIRHVQEVIVLVLYIYVSKCLWIDANKFEMNVNSEAETIEISSTISVSIDCLKSLPAFGIQLLSGGSVKLNV